MGRRRRSGGETFVPRPPNSVFAARHTVPARERRHRGCTLLGVSEETESSPRYFLLESAVFAWG